jgi:hypothetical protein
MTHLAPRMEAFVKLGKFLRSHCDSLKKVQAQPLEEQEWHQRFGEAVQQAHQQNPWFTQENVLHSFGQWAEVLEAEQLSSWLRPYARTKNEELTVALIMAGNIPLVGFHDLLCVLLTGHKALVKLSSNDQVLLPLLVSYLSHVDEGLRHRVDFTKEKLTDFDAVIATGSNNTARYFEYYFSKKPNIIRKNRNSVAVLTGTESEGELTALGEDIFRYFGLGCRSVSKIYVPTGYDLDVLFKAIYPYHELIHNQKYANNYDYNKAVYLMSGFQILDNGFLILKEDMAFASPIASLFYEFYTSKEVLKSRLKEKSEALQCIVSKGFIPDEIPFGHTQKPSLTDYADGVDTLAFLSGLP